MSINKVEYLGGGTSNTVSKARTEFGEITQAKKEPSHPVVAGNIKELVIPVNYDDLTGPVIDDIIFDTLQQNCLMLDAWLYVKETFAGGLNYEVGTYFPTGLPVDADGIFTAGDLALAFLTAGNWIKGTGLQLGVPLSDASQIGVVANGVFTSGKGTIILRYMDPL